MMIYIDTFNYLFHFLCFSKENETKEKSPRLKNEDLLKDYLPLLVALSNTM